MTHVLTVIWDVDNVGHFNNTKTYKHLLCLTTNHKLLELYQFRIEYKKEIWSTYDLKKR